MQKNESELKIYTIGHSNSPASKIIDLLKINEIDVLVDVRSSPYSQFTPQFNRETLTHTLELAGLEYRFAGEYLGGRPKDPNCYKIKQIPDGKADYLHLVDYPAVMTMDWFKKGLQRLIEISKQKRVAIICSEEDPANCHRHHLIGKALLAKGVEVLHIRGDGNLIKDQYLPNLSDEPPAEQLSFF